MEDVAEKLAGAVTNTKDENKPAEKDSKLNTNDPKPSTRFIGFFRIIKAAAWDMFPQMLSSEESVIKKINLTHGDVDIYVVNVDLPE